MSTREIALSIFNTLSEEQLIEFIKNFSDGGAEREAEKKDLEKKCKAFEDLSRRIEESASFYPIPEDNDKEVLAEHRMEKYGL